MVAKVGHFILKLIHLFTVELNLSNSKLKQSPLNQQVYHDIAGKLKTTILKIGMTTELVEQFVQAVRPERVDAVIIGIEPNRLFHKPFQNPFGFGNLGLQKEDRGKVAVLAHWKTKILYYANQFEFSFVKLTDCLMIFFNASVIWM